MRGVDHKDEYERMRTGERRRPAVTAAISLVAVGLIAIGPTALLAPQAMADGFGIPAATSEAHVYLYATAARDVALGGLLFALLWLGASNRVLGAAVTAIAFVAASDAVNVFVASGWRWVPALAIHVGGLAILLGMAAWLWRMRSE